MTDFEERFRDEVTIYLEIILQCLERKFSQLKMKENLLTFNQSMKESFTFPC